MSLPGGFRLSSNKSTTRILTCSTRDCSIEGSSDRVGAAVGCTATGEAEGGKSPTGRREIDPGRGGGGLEPEAEAGSLVQETGALRLAPATGNRGLEAEAGTLDLEPELTDLVGVVTDETEKTSA